jgi:hypothetical protein
MFSPILPIRPFLTSSTVGPKPSWLSGSADSAATSAGFFSATSAESDFAKARKESFLVTKSVSQFTSIKAPVVPSTVAATTPSAAIRDAALPALLPSLTRSSSSALSMSPSASVSAFLHSIIGASVLARSAPTMLAVIAAIVLLLQPRRAVEDGRRVRCSVVKKGLNQPLGPLAGTASRGADQAEASSTSTNSSPTAAPCTTSLAALALPSRTASATALAYSATAFDESSLPGIT